MTRMIVDGYLGRTAGLGSGGMDEVKWLKPIYANQTLTGRATVISARPSRSQPGRGILQMLWELHDQQGIKILEMTGVQFVRVKAP
jgi:acyl dehydratase